MINISLLIPTRNRPLFIRRLLNYYAQEKFSGQLLIGDSSDPEEAALTRRSIEEGGRGLQIRYEECFGKHIAPTVKHLFNFVATPYAAILPDDDFLVPAGLKQAAAFLDQHPACVGAQGKAVIYSLKTPGPFGILESVEPYGLRPISGMTASARLRRHFRQYSVTMFALYRAEILALMHDDVDRICDVPFASELLPCCLSVICGEIAQLPGLYLARQAHGSRYSLYDVFDWYGSINWAPSYQFFQERLVKELMRRDGLTAQAATALVKETFWGHIVKGMGESWSQRYSVSTLVSWKERLRQLFRRYSMPRYFWNYLKPLVTDQGELTWPALQRPASPYYHDFRSIQKTVSANV
ncbi:MAG: TIGR00180 family glycosyltransferase [Elusimicrobia bacterium]|nr:TIGR00180 family glycosyltransferase [Elusimicrobiota bacterium]